MSDWTVVGLIDQRTTTLHVAAIFPGDVSEIAETPSTGGLEPVVRVVDAATGAEAAAAAQVLVEGSEAMPDSAPCQACRHFEGGVVLFRDAFGHDSVGHRLANLVWREGYGDARSLLAADLAVLEGLRGVGAESSGRLRLARRRLRSATVG